MKNIVVLAIVSLILSSCNIYKTYQRPEQATASLDSLYRYDSYADDTMSLAILSWRELFTDPQLQIIIEKGLQNNTDIQIARLKVTEAQATLKAARLAYLPSVGLAPQASIITTIGAGAVSSQTYNLSASASWELDIFGKLTNAKNRAKAALEQSKAYEQAVQTQVVSYVANSYYALMLIDKQLVISKRTLGNWDENIRAMKALKEAGQVNEVAIAQAQANRMSVEASVKTLQKQMSAMENSLSSFLGEMSHSIARDTMGSQSFPEKLSTGVPLQLLSNRPDIRQAEYYLAQACYATNEARSAFYPSVTLSGAAGWANSGGGAIINPGTWLVNAVASLVQPIFNRGANQARLTIAKSQQEQAVLSFRQRLLDAGVEVNDALQQWQTARERIEISSAQVVTLQSAVRQSILLMNHTSANYLEVLTAQQSLLQSELTNANDMFDEIQGVINLYRALGGGVR